MSKLLNNLFDDDDDGKPAAPEQPVSTKPEVNYKELYTAERDKRLDLEITVFELKGEVRQLRDTVKQLTDTAAAAAAAAAAPASAPPSVEPSLTPAVTTAPEPEAEAEVEIAPTAARKQRDIFDSDSDADEEDDAPTPAGAPAQAPEPGPLVEQTTSEWERLAQEERERRRLKARQRQAQGLLRAPMGRKVSRRTVPSAVTPSETIHPTALSSPPLPHLPSPQPAPASASGSAMTPAPAPAASSFSSSEDEDEDEDSSDNDSGWDDDEEEEEESKGEATRSNNINSSSTGSGVNFRSSPQPTEPADDAHLSPSQLEAVVEASVLSWARGRDLAALLSTVHNVYHGPLPMVSLLTHAAGPAEVRKTYLRVVRCCHPDKQSAECSPRVRVEAQKVFSALADAYTAYRLLHGGE